MRPQLNCKKAEFPERLVSIDQIVTSHTHCVYTSGVCRRLFEFLSKVRSQGGGLYRGFLREVEL